jgi:predicted glutamine amidotransferase
MCIAVIIPPKKMIDKETYDECAKSNNHGYGFAYIKSKVLMVCKHPTDKEGIYQHLLSARSECPYSPILLHFRYATHGKRDKLNTHPHYSPEHKALIIHNGIISGYGTDAKSDTVDFVEKMIDKLPAKWYDNKALIALLEQAIGRYNKIAMLLQSGRVIVLNKNEWQTDKATGITYSNGGYKQTTYYYNSDSFISRQDNFGGDAYTYWKRTEKNITGKKIERNLLTAECNYGGY